MQIDANDYCLFYDALLNKFIDDFYEGDIAGLNRNGPEIWRLRFNQVKRLKAQLQYNDATKIYSFSGEVIPRILFGLTDTNGKYFHAKWKEALKSPTLFSVTTEWLYKALKYLMTEEPFDLDQVKNHRFPDKVKIEKGAQDLWAVFITQAKSNTQTKVETEVEDNEYRLNAVKAEAVQQIELFFERISTQKYLDAWQMLTSEFQQFGRWRNYTYFRKYFNSVAKTSQISELHIFNVKLKERSIQCHVFYHDKMKYLEVVKYSDAEEFLKREAKILPPQGLNPVIVQDIIDHNQGHLTSSDLGIPEEKWNAIFHSQKSKSIDKLDIYELVRVEDRLLIKNIYIPIGLNKDLEFYRSEIW